MKKLLIVASAAAIVLGQLSSAFANSMTSKVVSWDADSMELVLQDKQNIDMGTEGLEIPETLSAGDTVTIEFESGEDGFDKIVSITIDEDV